LFPAVPPDADATRFSEPPQRASQVVAQTREAEKPTMQISWRRHWPPGYLVSGPLQGGFCAVWKATTLPG
jgi:hypothetical protein